MKLAESRVTAQGQISVPSEVRRKLGLAPGSLLVWEQHGEVFVVRRSGTFTSADIRAVLFADTAPKKRSNAQIKDAIRERMKQKHARC
ncbi:MAG: AbrB/MazE/SpoVT family DNA-binding domain-containing protein [Clostridia bacterium]|nr:AbrB/MazE/SpoVT family DNA-binding domain-containing protein [Deltaproteobacteria bacterium]